MKADQAKQVAKGISEQIDALVESVRATRHCPNKEARRVVGLWIIEGRRPKKLLSDSEWQTTLIREIPKLTTESKGVKPLATGIFSNRRALNISVILRHKTGCFQEDIAEEFEVSQRVVSKIITEYNKECRL